MKERPIIFSAQSVRAILEGRKTMTRRVVKLPRGCSWYGALGGEREGWWVDDSCPAWFHIDELRCPYGQPGGRRLWVREKWRIGAWDEDRGAVAIDYFDGPRREWIDVPDPTLDGELFNRLWQQSTDDARAAGLTPDDDGRYRWAPGESPCRWRPSIHMPRWASRITLEIESVRVERLQDISEADALAEGVERIFPAGHPADTGPNHYTTEGPERVSLNQPTAVGAFRALWTFINGDESWAANPWVWVIAFKRVTP